MFLLTAFQGGRNALLQKIGRLGGVAVTLQSLALSNANIAENSPTDTIVGSITNLRVGEVPTLSDNAGNRFKVVNVSGSWKIAVATVITDYETATSHSITLVGTLAGATGSPKSTTLSIAVINQNDSNPSAFTFTDVTGVALSTVQTSNTITIAGLNASDSATAAVSGDVSSQLQKNGGSWVSGPVSVVNGDTVTARHTSSASNSVSVSTTLTVGTTSDTFTSTTLAGASMLAVPRDTRWGTSTDANGWITQNLGGSNRIVYLDTVNGNDANTGLSHAQRKKSWNAAQALFISAGCKAGDKLLVAEGSSGMETTLSSLDPIAIDPTGSPSNLTAIQSYDPTDPTNQAKWGRAIGAAVPIIQFDAAIVPGISVVNVEGAGYVLYQGIELRCTNNSGAVAATALSWSTNRHPGMVVQNCRFNGVGLANSSGNGSNSSATNTQNAGLVSKCSFWGASGCFIEETDSFRIQEVFGAHGGWDIFATRDDPIIFGGPLVFSHMFYLHASNTNLHLNRVMVMDATDGLGARCGSPNANQLVSIDNPVGITAGGKSSDVVAERPDGAPWNCDDVVIMGLNKYIQPGNYGGWALEFLNTKIGSYTRNVAVFDFDDYGTYGVDVVYNRYFAGTRLSAAQVPTYMLCDKWSGFHIADTAESDSGTDLGNYHLDVTNSVLDVLPSGFNGTVSGVTTRSVAPAGYVTRSGMYGLLGYANRSHFANAMCWRPDLIGQTIQAICAIGLPAMGNTPLYQTASPPTPPTGVPVVYKTALTDLTASTLNFTRGVPSYLLLDGIVPGSVLSCADLPSGFSMAPFRLQTSGTATSGSNQVTGMGTVAGVLPGMLIEAKSNSFTPVSLFPAGTVVVSVSGTTITCSANATGSTTIETIVISAGGRMVSWDGSGSGAATPTIHVLEKPKDVANMGTHTTALVLNIASGAAWNPSLAATPAKAWYDISDTSTLFQDSAGTTPVTADGQAVLRVNDKSGNGMHLTAPAGFGLVYHTNSGKPYLTMSGGSDDLRTSGFANTLGDGSGQLTLGFAINFTSNAVVHDVLQGINIYGPIIKNAVGTALVNAYNAGGSIVATDSGPAISAATNMALTSIGSTTAVEAFVNGTGNGSTANGSAPGTTGDKFVYFGGSSAGRIYAFAVFPAALGSTDHASLVTWLQSKM